MIVKKYISFLCIGKSVRKFVFFLAGVADLADL